MEHNENTAQLALPFELPEGDLGVIMVEFYESLTSLAIAKQVAADAKSAEKFATTRFEAASLTMAEAVRQMRDSGAQALVERSAETVAPARRRS